MIPPLRNFDDVDGRERGQKKTDDLRAMTTLGPRTLDCCTELVGIRGAVKQSSLVSSFEY